MPCMKRINRIVEGAIGKIMYNATKKKYFNTSNPYNASISEIIPGFLYLSNIMLLEHKQFLCFSKVKYVLSIVTENVFASIRPDIDELMVVKNIPMEDVPGIEISKYFKEAHEFIEDARAKNCKILVHCEGGISRSPTIVISYLMKYNRMTLKEAMEHVSQQRPIICPNMGFMSELKKFEECLRSTTAATATAIPTTNTQTIQTEPPKLSLSQKKSKMLNAPKRRSIKQRLVSNRTLGKKSISVDTR